MSVVEEEIMHAKATARARIARLRARQRRDQQRLDAAVLEILRGRVRPEALAAIEAEAQLRLDTESAKRSERARAARQPRGESAS